MKIKFYSTTAMLFFNRLEDYIQVLEKEVNIDFCRSMNRIIFDKTVQEDPVTFAFVTLPPNIVISTPERGRVTCTSVKLMNWLVADISAQW